MLEIAVNQKISHAFHKFYFLIHSIIVAILNHMICKWRLSGRNYLNYGFDKNLYQFAMNTVSKTDIGKYYYYWFPWACFCLSNIIWCSTNAIRIPVQNNQNIIGLVGTCVIGLALFTYTVGELISVNAIDNLDTHAFNMEIK